MCFNNKIECDGKGNLAFSCCGDNITNNLPENDLCPTCREHCGDGVNGVCDVKDTCELIK